MQHDATWTGRDMDWRLKPNFLILLASPAGFEPATCGLEIRCCYPTELRGRDGQLLPQDRLRLPAPHRPAFAVLPADQRHEPIAGDARTFFPSSLSARCETGVISHDH